MSGLRMISIGIVSLLLAGAGPLAAQAVEGKLLQKGNDLPIGAATVRLLPERGRAVTEARTNEDGEFELSAPAAGIYRLQVERSGFRPAETPAVELRTGDRAELVVRVATDTVVLAGLEVTAYSRRPRGRLGGFYDRMERGGFGHFIARAEIEKRHPFRVTDLLWTVPGLVLTPAQLGFGYVATTPAGCAPRVYLDGMRFALLGESIDAIVPPIDLEGIEVYTHGAGVPVEYAADAACGVILLWTRTS